ncbi:class I SAM-dependent methyltransferase [Xylanimonas protaetiae]|uniref:Methyltransferase domain-containing protein n=1 Tax=Xylanimonas protaetiae TaxID=2509457 RepID=A0A4P6EZS8_9MICO|nr:methyltransferase [Xylanimonas protaetiae]QAY68970.1 methyltransferase domain-containing protein [Xylanimonas protaetiae]
MEAGSPVGGAGSPDDAGLPDGIGSPDDAAALAALTPWPEDGTRADGPVAVDATDRLLLLEARALLGAGRTPADVVVMGDRFGALTVGLLALGVPCVRLHTDAVTAERAVAANLDAVRARGLLGPATLRAQDDGSTDATRDERTGRPGDRWVVHEALEPALVRGARLVLLQLPRSLAELQEVAELVAREAADDVVLLAGGRLKHMTHAMNDVLAACFEDVRATLARGKSRALVAARPRAGARTAAPTFPVVATLRDPELLAAAGLATGHDAAPAVAGRPADAQGAAAGIAVVAHGGVFAGATLDLGTRALLRTAGRWPEAADAVDLGCGTGLLATVLALRDPRTRVVAVDRSAAAAASARATSRANGVAERVVVLRDDAGEGAAPGSADLVLCNPPFHDRAALSTDAAHRMFAAAARMLRPGGELWCVYNAGLRYRPALERTVGPTEQVSRDPRFTVTRSATRSATRSVRADA